MKFSSVVFSFLIIIHISCSKDKSDGNIEPYDSNKYVCNYSYSSLSFNSPSRTIYPKNGLAEAIIKAKAGDIIELEAGDYGYDDLSINALTDIKKESYILIKAKSGANVRFTAYYYNLRMNRCSYMIFDGITFTGGGIGINLQNCDHIILINCNVTNQEQEGIKICGNSKYIDIVNCKIWNTGTVSPKWGEGIYVGTPGKFDSNGDGIADKFDYTSRVWIENCEMFSCGKGEAINFKGDVMESTIRGCSIYNVSPGTFDQANDGAISLEAIVDISNVKRRNNYVELCAIENVSGGYTGTTNEGYVEDYNCGIAIFGSGNTIQNNRIKKCANIGIYGNNYGTKSTLVNYVYNNTITDCKTDISIDNGIKISETDNPNPFTGQMKSVD